MKLVYKLRRGVKGLGVDVNSHNVIVSLTPGGQAQIDGLAREGDTVYGVDGVQVHGRLSQSHQGPS